MTSDEAGSLGCFIELLLFAVAFAAGVFVGAMWW